MNSKEIQKYKVENAVIMAAGFSSRFAPLSYECPKALLKVKGEVLIERQIRQLKEVGIKDITVVVGYKKELFTYLEKKLQVKIVENPEYDLRNNHSSLYYVKEILGNTYICSSDNYFTENIFKAYANRSYYSSIFQKGRTKEWSFDIDESNLITDVKIGGYDSWIMIGHAFFTKEFSKKFVEILEDLYELPETLGLFWENIYIDNIEKLPMYIDKYSEEVIFEFDTLDELRDFDEAYWESTGSEILVKLCKKLKCRERDIVGARPIIKNDEAMGFEFFVNNRPYKYYYKTRKLK